MRLLSCLLALVAFANSAQASDAAYVADKLYNAFAKHDSATMTELYAESEAPVFSDPIFQNLNTREVRGMWQMLVAAGHDLTLSYQIESSTETQAIVAWRAEYTYSGTGNKVVNEVRSTLTIRDGKIVAQRDDFDLCRWTRQALGMVKGTLACTFPGSLRSQARGKLDQFLASQGK